MDTCARSGCQNPIWDRESNSCILHSEVSEKPDFWSSVRDDRNRQIRTKLGLPSNASIDDLPDRRRHEAQTDFREVVFPEGDFPSWFFGFPIMLYKCRFLGPTGARGFETRHSINFIECSFSGPLAFVSMTIGAPGLTFHQCRFSDALLIELCRIDRVVLRRSEIQGNISIADTSVGDRITIQSSTLLSQLALHSITFDKTKATYAISVENTQLPDADIDWDSFDTVRFRACKWWLRRSSLGGMIRLPDGLTQAGMEETLRRKEEQFRQLRRLSQRDGNTVLANEFHIFEIETQRVSLAQSPLARRTAMYWFLTMYKYLSLYNGSFLRPLMWLAVLALLLPLFHFYGGFEIRHAEGSSEVIEYSFEASEIFDVSSFGQRSRDFLEAANFTFSSMIPRISSEYSPISTASRMSRTAGQLMGPTLILLFAFALRRRYRASDRDS